MEWHTYNKETKLSQSDDGATYNYLLLSNNHISRNCKTYEGIISGINGKTVANFRYGTKYIQLFAWLNYDSIPNVTFYMKNIVIKKIA